MLAISTSRCIVAFGLLLYSSDAYAASRTEFVARHEAERVEGAEVCFWPARSDDGFFEKFLSSNDVRCVSADAVVDIPSGFWNFYAQKDQNLISFHPDFVSNDGTDPEDSYRRVAIELHRAGIVSRRKVSLGAGEWVALYIPNEARNSSPAVVRPFSTAAQDLAVPAGTTVVPLIVRDSTISRVGEPFAVPPEGNYELPALEQWFGGRFVVGLIQISGSELSADAPLIVLSAEETTEIQPLIPPRKGEGIERSLAIFRNVPVGSHRIRLSGDHWQLHEVTAEIKADSRVTRAVDTIVAAGAGSLDVSWSLGPFRDMVSGEPCVAAEEGKARDSAVMRVLTCEGERECATVHEESLAGAEGRLRLVSLAPRQYKVELAFDDHGKSELVSVDIAESSRADLELESESIPGRVTLGGQPVRAFISLSNSFGAAESDDSGHFEVAVNRRPVESRISIRICQPTLEYEFLPEEPIDSFIDIDIPLNELTVIVRDEQGSPLQGALVNGGPLLEKGDEEYSFLPFSPTDESGSARVSTVPTMQPLRICAAHHPEFERSCAEDFVLGNDSTKVVTIRLTRKRTLSGRILSESMFRGGRVFLMNRSGLEKDATPVREDGEFHLNVPPQFGDYFVIASLSHPIAAVPLPASNLEELTLIFPALPVRDVIVEAHRASTPWALGIEIDGMPVSSRAFFAHQSFRRGADEVQPGGSLVISSIAAGREPVVYAIPALRARPPDWGALDPMQIPALRATLSRYLPQNGLVSLAD